MEWETVLILQGGGALGAYECGVYKALEEKSIRFDLVAGVSIGAVNAAIIASHPRGEAAKVLEAFWTEIAVSDPPLLQGELRRLMVAAQILTFGVPKLFTPRWLIPNWNVLLPFTWTSFYDPTPLKRTLEHYVDFERLGLSGTRLLLTAVNVETGELEVFDSAEQRLTVEHILASGSLPPGLPWMTIDGKAYWDGGLVSNTPLQPVVEKRRGISLKIYIVNLFPKAQPLPKNLAGVLARQKDILYRDKTESNILACEMHTATLELIHELMAQLDPAIVNRIKQSERYQRLAEQGCRVDITRFTHEGEAFESESKDYDFSRGTIQAHIRHGYEQAQAILAQEARAAGS